MKKFTTREEWMTALVARLLPRYIAAAEVDEPPRIRVSLGRTSTKKAIGECWHAKAREIFIRPDHDAPLEVADIISHEMVHAFLPADAGHGTAFKRLGMKVGLTGKPTEMEAGPELLGDLKKLCRELGRFPHAALSMIRLKKKQIGRLMKVECLETGYTVRVTRAWLDNFGAPICPCCETSMEGDTE